MPSHTDLAGALRASRERYRAVVDAALDCVVAMDRRGIVVDWNPAAERTFGYAAEEALGREMAELIVPPHLRDAHRAGLARSLAGGAPVVLERRIEITAMRRDGEEFPCELTITRIAEPGEPLFVGYVRDITARRRADAELRASRARIVDAADAAPRAPGARPARRRAAAPRRPGAHAAAGAAEGGSGSRADARAARRGDRRSRRRHRRAARAGARDPPGRPDRGRAGAGARRARGPRPGPRRPRGRPGRAAARRGRGDRVLRRRRGPDQRRPLRRCAPRGRHARRSPTAGSPSRCATTAAAAPTRGPAAACAGSPTASPRSTAASAFVSPPGGGTTCGRSCHARRDRRGLRPAAAGRGAPARGRGLRGRRRGGRRRGPAAQGARAPARRGRGRHPDAAVPRWTRACRRRGSSAPSCPASAS